MIIAAATLPSPGKQVKVRGRWTTVGPCATPCKHKDCANTREMANSICPFCKQPIDYEKPFYDDRGNISIAVELRTLVHADCLEAHIVNATGRRTTRL